MALNHSLFRTALLCCWVLMLSACGDSEPDPETQLRETLNAIQEAAESRDLSAMMAHVSDRYLDADGRDNRQVRAVAQFQLLRNPKIFTFKIVKSLKLNATDKADVSLLVAIAATPIAGPSSVADVRADMMWFDLQFAYEKQWKLVAAVWRPADATDFL